MNSESFESDSREPETGKSQLGRVIAHFGKRLVVADASGQQHRCVPRRHLPPLVCGDWVEWDCSDPKACVVTGLEPRRSLLARPDPRGRQKIIAANIDQILIVNAPQPPLNEGLLDRYLVAAEYTGIHPVIVLNKSDLLDQQQHAEYQQRLAIYQAIGYEVIFTSVNDNCAFDVLLEHLRDKTSILVGQSGVGKSSILNHLLPHVNTPVGEVSEITGKGRHTTTTTRFYPLADNGAVIDSPGIREFGLWQVTPQQLPDGFVEFTDYVTQCRFRDCMHQNEPGCAVIDAVNKGNIAEQRYQSYLRILESLTNGEN